MLLLGYNNCLILYGGKIEASRTKKIREFANVQKELYQGKYFSCEENQILRRMQIFFEKILNMIIAAIFKAQILGIHKVDV